MSVADASRKLPRKGLTRQLLQLSRISCGPGAIAMPSNVTKLRFEFLDGAKGPKTFWRQHLPQVQFHNPSLPITVIKHSQEAKPNFPPEFIVDFANGQQKRLKLGSMGWEKYIDELVKLTDAKEVPIEQQTQFKVDTDSL